MSGPRRRKPRRQGLNRRDFLKRAGAASAAIATLPILSACDESGGLTAEAKAAALINPFLHGVASGDPLPDRVMFWTRVTTDRAAVDVRLQVSDEPALRNILRDESFRTDASRDYTVKIDLDGLLPGKTYYYRFSALGKRSVIGRTRTAPVGRVQRLRVGVVSCSNYAHGFFNAYRKLAQRADVDVVLHLGDYIYEYGNGEYGGARTLEPGHEIITLTDYRRRHAHYRLDPDLQEVHRQHPFITVWDDHETANDAWKNGAENHTEGLEGSWPQRKGWGIQAYNEWMPIRVRNAARPDIIYRNFRFGNLAEFIMLDTRLTGRDQQAGLTDAASINNSERQLLGQQQRGFLAAKLGSSTAKWKFLGQQVMFGQLRLLPLPELSLLTGIPIAELQALLQSVPVVSTGGLIINPDQWDGYRAERNRVFDLIQGLNLDNVVVLTGDIHTSWAMDLTPDPTNLLVYNPLTGEGSRAVEFVTTSVTSPGLDALAPVQDLIKVLNLHMKYVDLARKGYLLLDITPERTQGEFWYIDTIAQSSNNETFGAAFFSGDGLNRLSAGGPSQPLANPPALAP